MSFQKDLEQLEAEGWKFLTPRLIIGGIVVLLAAIYIYWPRHPPAPPPEPPRMEAPAR